MSPWRLNPDRELEGVDRLSRRARTFLAMMNLRVVGDLQRIKSAELHRYKGVGEKTAKELLLWARRWGYRFEDGACAVPSSPKRCPTCGATQSSWNLRAAVREMGPYAELHAAEVDGDEG